MDDDAESGDTGWQPPASSVPSPAPGPPSSERGDALQGRIVGWARSVQMRSEQDPNDSSRQFTVLTFHVERTYSHRTSIDPTAASTFGSI
jgi:hypothetical protein